MMRLPSGKKPISGVMLSAFARLWDAARTCPLGNNMRAKVRNNTRSVSGRTRSQIVMLAKKRFDPMNVSLWLGFAGVNTLDSVFDTLLENG
jgi:hypothetical protein